MKKKKVRKAPVAGSENGKFTGGETISDGQRSDNGHGLEQQELCETPANQNHGQPKEPEFVEASPKTEMSGNGDSDQEQKGLRRSDTGDTAAWGEEHYDYYSGGVSQWREDDEANWDNYDWPPCNWRPYSWQNASWDRSSAYYQYNDYDWNHEKQKKTSAPVTPAKVQPEASPTSTDLSRSGSSAELSQVTGLLRSTTGELEGRSLDEAMDAAANKTKVQPSEGEIQPDQPKQGETKETGQGQDGSNATKETKEAEAFRLRKLKAHARYMRYYRNIRSA